MLINPVGKTVTYKLDSLAEVEAALNEIEKDALEKDSIQSADARSIFTEVQNIKDALGLKRGPSRHPKWAPELQAKSI